eukprot:365570-Chlamydomonas_euryale.AAC.2
MSTRKPAHIIWRDENARKQLPGYTDWLRNTPDALWCDVISVKPRIRLPWRYTLEQEEEGDVWECGAVWLHSACRANGEVYTAELHNELRQALDILNENIDAAKKTLLVDPNGMFYDARRLGGDHQVYLPQSGRRFTFSVRRGTRTNNKLLLAIDWGRF